MTSDKWSALIIVISVLVAYACVSYIWYEKGKDDGIRIGKESRLPHFTLTKEGYIFVRYNDIIYVTTDNGDSWMPIFK